MHLRRCDRRLARRFALLAAVLAAAVVVAGCPSPDNDEDAGASPEELVEGEQRPGEDVDMTPLENDNGYALDGPHNFEGTLAFSEGQWLLEGQFTFATGGYSVEEPGVQVMESMPEHVRITMTVLAPPPDAMVTQAITTASVNARFQASRDAQMDVRVVTETQESLS